MLYVLVLGESNATLRIGREGGQDLTLPVDRFPNDLPNVGTYIDESEVVRDVNRDLPEISMLRRDGLECHNDP